MCRCACALAWRAEVEEAVQVVTELSFYSLGSTLRFLHPLDVIAARNHHLLPPHLPTTSLSPFTLPFALPLSRLPSPDLATSATRVLSSLQTLIAPHGSASNSGFLIL